MLKDVTVDGVTYMDSVTDNQDGTYTFELDIWNGYTPFVHFEFADAAGYKVSYNPSGETIVVTDMDGNSIEGDVLHAYGAEATELKLKLVASVGYDYATEFSGIKVVQKNFDTDETVVTFIKRNALDTDAEEAGVYYYTITDTSVLTEISVVDWVYPFDKEYKVDYDKAYDAKVEVSIDSGTEAVANPYQIYEYGEADVMTFKLTPPTDVDASNYKDGGWKNQFKFYVTENENESLQSVNYADNFEYDETNNTFTMSISMSETTRGMVFVVYWTAAEEIFAQMNPDGESYFGEYGAAYNNDSYGTVTVEKKLLDITEHCTYRDGGKVKIAMEDDLDPMVAVKITPDANSVLDNICLGEDSFADSYGDMEHWPSLSYDVATDTYTYLWNVNEGYLNIDFDKATEKILAVSASCNEALDTVTVAGTAKNITTVDVVLYSDAYCQNALDTKSGITVADSRFACTFEGLSLTDQETYYVVVTDASEDKNEIADTASAEFVACSEHDYENVCIGTVCITCGDERAEAPGHDYSSACDTKCDNCNDGSGDRVAATAHSYDNECIDTECADCGETRTEVPGHTTSGDCDEKCNVCQSALTPLVDHTYDSCEDTVCNVCEETRTAMAHKYTDCDDTSCDNEGCTKTRTAPGHSYTGQTWMKDATSHWQKCANCSATSTREPHNLVEQADGSSKCSTCGYIVECEEVPNVTVSYKTHIQTFGWEKEFKTDGEMSGTSGKAKRLEGIEIIVDSAEAGKDVDLGIQYTTHCQTYGWLPWSADGDMNGTEGEAKRLEAIKIQLTGEDADEYDVYYRVHAQTYGWLGWASNGAAAGTAGLAKRLEGIQIVVVKKGETFDKNMEGITSKDSRAYIAKDGSTDATVTGAATPNVTYRTHVQKYGWQAWKYNGVMSGTSGEAKRLEGIEIKLTNKDCEGGIAYCTHVQTYAWQGADLDDPTTWKQDGKMAGTSGEAKRLEAICITLTGEMAEKYDVYYRVHAQTYGWLSWASNGAPAGTAGYAKRLEGIQIVIVPKGEKPADNYQGVTSTNAKSYIEK